MAVQAQFGGLVASSSAALLPIPGMQRAAVAQHHSPAPAAVAARMADSSATASTSGRAAAAAASSADALVAELCHQGAEVDAPVRAECERLRAGLEQARKRQRQALVRAAAAGAARALREKEAELGAARRRAAELEERLRQAAAESQAWCGLARSNEAAATGLHAALDTLLLRGAGAGVAPAQPAVEEGFDDSGAGLAGAAADDAESHCFVEAEAAGADTDASSPAASRWPCRACGGGEASVLLLPCRGWGGSAPCRSGGERGSSVPLTTIGEREGLGKIYKGKNGTRKIGRCSLMFLHSFFTGQCTKSNGNGIEGFKVKFQWQ